MITTDLLYNRIAGGLLGVHAGDSFGASLEFRDWLTIQRDHPPGNRLRDITGGGQFDWQPGEATDDTDLTRAVLDAYIPEPSADVVRAAADNMVTWFHSDPPDIGNATYRGIERYLSTGDPTRAGAGPNARGNGSLMRCIPTGLARRDNGLRRSETAAISAVTHNAEDCVGACVIYNEIVNALLEGLTATEAVEWVDQLPDDLFHTPAVRDAVSDGCDLSIPDLVATGDTGLDYDPTGGHVLQSLTIAVAAVLDHRPIEDILIDIVHFGGDADTNAAIAGGLVGVRDGASTIPARWVQLLEHGAHFMRAVPHLAYLRNRPT